MKALVALVAVVSLLAGCGGSGSSSGSGLEFSDRTAFESYVAGYLAVDSVSCDKTSETAARCTDPDGQVVLVLCETADEVGGNNCTISRPDE